MLLPFTETIKHAKRKRHEIEGGEARVLAQDGGAGDETGQQDDGDAGDKAAKAHGGHRQSGDEEADCRAGQDGVAHGVAHQAQAPQHQEDADRRRAERQGEAADQRAAHEGEFDEGIDEGVDHAGPTRFAALADFGMLVPGLGELARLGEVLRRQHLLGRAPGHDLAGEQQRPREVRPHLIEIVQRGDHGAPFAGASG